MRRRADALHATSGGMDKPAERRQEAHASEAPEFVHIWRCGGMGERARRLAGHKFVRQAPIDRYFADFLCRDLKLVIEVDGGTHGTDAEIAADATRNLALESQGYFIFRVHNQEIYENLSGVLESLHEVIANRQRTRSRPSS